MAQNAEIGNLIMRLNPYTNNRLVGKGGSPAGDMDVFMALDPPTQGGDPAATILEMQLEVDAAYPGEWTFKGQPHRLGKTARLKYRFPVMSGPTAAATVLYWVEDYVLIGFEDGGI